MPQQFIQPNLQAGYSAAANTVGRLGDITSQAVSQYLASRKSANHVAEMKKAAVEMLTGFGKQNAGLTDQDVQAYQSRIVGIDDPDLLDKQVLQMHNELMKKAETYQGKQATLGVTQDIAKQEAPTPAVAAGRSYGTPAQVPVSTGTIQESNPLDKGFNVPPAPQPQESFTEQNITETPAVPATAGRRLTAEDAQMAYSKAGADPDKALIEQKKIADIEAEKLKRAELAAKARKYADDLRAESAKARNAILKANAARSAKGASSKAQSDYLAQVATFSSLKDRYIKDAEKIENDGGDATELRNEIITIDRELQDIRATSTNVQTPYSKTANTPKPKDPLGLL